MIKADLLLDAIGMISDDIIRDAKQPTKVVKRNWVKWGAIAASFMFLVVIAISVPYIFELGDKNCVEPLNVFEFNGAYYEIVDMNDTAILNKYNLPKKINDEMIGNYLSLMESNQEKYDLYDYKGNTTQNNIPPILICKSANGKYAFALFCNFIHSDTVSFEEADILFAIFGISSFDNIAKLEMNGVSTTDVSVKKALYEGLLKADAMCNDDFQLAVYGGNSETEQQEIIRYLADNNVSIRLENESGQVSYMVYYQTIKYICWYQNYYKLSDDVCELINNHN